MENLTVEENNAISSAVKCLQQVSTINFRDAHEAIANVLNQYNIAAAQNVSMHE